MTEPAKRAVASANATGGPASNTEDYGSRRRKMAVIDSYGWTGSQWRLQHPTFTWEKRKVGEGFIRVPEAKLLEPVTLEGIPDDLQKVVLTADLFGGPYLEIARNADGKFVLPEGFDLSPALYRN